MNDRDYELITAYIDGALTEAERQMFESHLSAEPDLRRELNSLRQTVALLRQLPGLKAPRNFTLTNAQVESRPAARTALPFPLTVTFSALSAAAAVLLFVFGGYFLLQTNMMPMASNLNTSVQQEAQQAAQPTALAFALTATTEASATTTPLPTATALPSTTPMPTLLPPTAMADLALEESEGAPAAVLAPPGEAPEDATLMMFSTGTPDADQETAMFRMAATEMPAVSDSLEIESAADTAAGGAGAVMLATQAILAPNPLMTDAALFATLGANFAQYGETPLPSTSTAQPDVQNQADDGNAAMLADATLAMPTETPVPQDGDLQTGTDERDDFAEPASVAREREESAPAIDITGPLLVGVGGLLLVIAIVTTIIRRRRNTL